jgi:hypothetical protein
MGLGMIGTIAESSRHAIFATLTYCGAIKIKT